MPTKRQAALLERRMARERFIKSRIAERDFQAKLTAVGRQVGQLVRGFVYDGKVTDQPALDATMRSYARTLNPWAKAISSRMIADVSTRDLVSWRYLSNELGSGLFKEIQKAPTGIAMREMLAECVGLITSLPTEAAQRVHELTIQARVDSRRANEIATEIMRSGHVTVSRAQLIARTEVSRTASTLVEVRAVHVGSDGYIWRTSDDGDVRPDHVKLEGRMVRWDDPPVAGPKGMRYHAGRGPNCRCFCEPNLPDTIR